LRGSKNVSRRLYVTTAEAAIEALKSQEFRAVFLDHDLHWMHADNTIVKGTGREVAPHLKETSFPGIIVIHSKHDEAADVMSRILPQAKRARFGEFDIVPAKRSGTAVLRCGKGLLFADMLACLGIRDSVRTLRGAPARSGSLS
jgi:hypothetical protein